MKNLFYPILAVFLCAAIQAQAQALSERYTKQRPAVIVSDNYQYNEIAKAIAAEIGIHCIFTKMSDYDANIAFDNDEADVIITTRDSGATARIVSKSIIGYSLHKNPSNAAIRFVGKDHQLIEQIDDQYMRMKQDGIIAEIMERWEHPELAEPKDETMALQITEALLILSGILLVASQLILWHIRRTRLHSVEVKEMINQAKIMSDYYAIEDNQAAHNLAHKYEAIICNPFIAIAFYDNNGKLIVENDVMKKLGKKLGNIHEIPRRQPLYNANGEVTNYISAFVPPTT